MLTKAEFSPSSLVTDNHTYVSHSTNGGILGTTDGPLFDAVVWAFIFLVMMPATIFFEYVVSPIACIFG